MCVSVCFVSGEIIIIMLFVIGPSQSWNCHGLCSPALVLCSDCEQRAAGVRAGKMRWVLCLEAHREKRGKLPCASEKVTSPIQQTNRERYWSQLSWASHFLGTLRLKVSQQLCFFNVNIKEFKIQNQMARFSTCSLCKYCSFLWLEWRSSMELLHLVQC